MALFAFLPEIVAFFLFIMVSTQVADIGPYLVLAQMGLVGFLLVLKPAAFIETFLRWWPLLLVPILATLSAIWSDVPMVSLRYGAQLLFTAFVGVHLARMMSPRRFVTVFFISVFVFCILCILFGRQGTSATGMVLIGLTGSKNQMAYEGQLLLLSALTVLMLTGVSKPLRWLAMLALPLAVFVLAGTNSATAVLQAIAGALALFGFVFLQRLPPAGRVGLLIGSILVLTPLIALAPEASEEINYFVTETLQKDATLTGRTELWERADALIERRPILGYGYQSIWMGDSDETIALLRLSGQSDGRTFHFHNTFRQFAVDTGLIGMAVLIITLLTVFVGGLSQLLTRPTPQTSFFFLVFLLLLSRSYFDIIMSPFSIHTMFLFASATYAFWRQAPVVQTAQAPVQAPAPSFTLPNRSA